MRNRLGKEATITMHMFWASWQLQYSRERNELFTQAYFQGFVNAVSLCAAPRNTEVCNTTVEGGITFLRNLKCAESYLCLPKILCFLPE